MGGGSEKYCDPVSFENLKHSLRPKSPTSENRGCPCLQWTPHAVPLTIAKEEPAHRKTDIFFGKSKNLFEVGIGRVEDASLGVHNSLWTSSCSCAVLPEHYFVGRHLTCIHIG